MTSTPPQEQSSSPNTPSKLMPREDTANEGYTGFDPSSGLYYYTDGTNRTMFYDGYSGQWLYWNDEGQYYYPIHGDGSNPADAEKNKDASSSERKDASAIAGAGASLGPPAGSGSNMGSYQTSQYSAATTTTATSNTNQESRKVPDEDKHPLPFRLTSGVQSERDRLLGASGKSRNRQRIDWGAALENYSLQGYGGRSGGLGHFSNPPILPPRFYYPHVVPGSYYDFLNIRPNASVEEVEESVQWWELVGYPRAHEADGERADRIHRLIMEAALIITNSSLRAQYDQTLPLGGKGKKAAAMTSSMQHGHGMLDVSTHVPRVLHFHQDGENGENGRSGYGSRSSSRPTSVTSTPSKYPGVGKPTPGGASTTSTNGESSSQQDAHHALLEEDISQPSISERLFAAVSEGIFGPPRTKPKNKKYAARGMEWVEDERRRMEGDDDGENGENNNNGNAPGSSFKVTNTTTNVSSQHHVDPAKKATNGEQQPMPAKPPLA